MVVLRHKPKEAVQLLPVIFTRRMAVYKALPLRGRQQSAHQPDEGGRMVSFSADEINLIYQFGENGREGTLANLKEIEPRITDAVTKEIVGAAIHKCPAVCFSIYCEQSYP